MKETATQVIACDLTAIPAAERTAHVINAPRLFQCVQEVRMLENGYALRFPNVDGMWLQLATFVENERRCCPFYRFVLTVEPNQGDLWLMLSGPAGAKELLTAALSEQSGEDVFKRLIHTGGDPRLEQAVAKSVAALAGVLTR